MTRLFVWIVLWLPAPPGLAWERAFLESYVLANGQVLVVAQAALEPLSIGSYSLRLYSGRNPAYPHDEFLAGLIRPRDGMLESVHLLQPLRIVVISRSVGTGGYRSADLFEVRDKQIRWLRGVSGVLPDADIFSELDRE